MSAEKRNLRRMLPALLLVLLLGGCASRPGARIEAPELLEPRGVTMDTVPVTKGTIWRTDVLEGMVLPGVRELSFETSGTVGNVYVCAGSHVKEGDVLAALDVSYYESALESQKETLRYRESTEAITEREQDIEIELQGLTLEAMREAGASDSDLRLQELAIEKLKNERKKARALWKLDHEAMLESIRTLEAQIAAGFLIAPCDGTVVACLAADGGFAMENVGTIWLAEDAALYLSVDAVSTSALREACEIYATVAGRRVEVDYRAAEDRDYVMRFTSTGDATSAFDIRETNGNPVEAGMSAVVFLISDRTEDALIVPSTAVRFDGSYFVYQMIDGNQVRQNVKCGVMNDAEVQILEGLQEGDVVYAGT